MLRPAGSRVPTCDPPDRLALLLWPSLSMGQAPISPWQARPEGHKGWISWQEPARPPLTTDSPARRLYWPTRHVGPPAPLHTPAPTPRAPAQPAPPYRPGPARPSSAPGLAQLGWALLGSAGPHLPGPHSARTSRWSPGHPGRIAVGAEWPTSTVMGPDHCGRRR